MAGNLKMASADAPVDDKILTRKLLNNLKKVECPLLLNKEDWWIQNVLFSTPEYHIELLYWILVHFKEFRESLNENCSFKDCSIEAKVEKLVRVCTRLGLWEGFNESIVKGTASTRELYQFWEFIVDIFLVKQNCMESSEDLGGSYLSMNRSKTKTLGSAYADACQNLEAAAKQSLHPNYFPTSAPLFHPEIEEALKRFTLSTHETDRLKMPRMHDLKKIQDEIDEKLGRKSDAVNIYCQKGDFEYTASEGLASETEQRLQNLEVDLFTAHSSLRQLVQEFDTFHDQIKTQLGRKEEEIPELGAKYEVTCQKLQKLTKILEKFSLIKDSYAKLQSLKQEQTASDVKTLLPGFFDEITERLPVLERLFEN